MTNRHRMTQRNHSSSSKCSVQQTHYAYAAWATLKLVCGAARARERERENTLPVNDSHVINASRFIYLFRYPPPPPSSFGPPVLLPPAAISRNEKLSEIYGATFPPSLLFIAIPTVCCVYLYVCMCVCLLCVSVCIACHGAWALSELETFDF